MKLLLIIISQPFFSRIWGRIMRIKKPKVLASFMVKTYRNIYNIDMNEYQGTLGDYSCISDFFIRKLNSDVRPLNKSKGYIVSPADGKVLPFHQNKKDKVIQVKNIDYSINELCGEELNCDEKWNVGVIYLSPANYHRFHFPADAILKEWKYIRGRLYPVNSLGLNNIKSLFVKNERVILKFACNNIDFYAVAVGATNVGSIKISVAENIDIRKKSFEKLNKEVEQLDEMGRFELGSTIVLLVPEKLALPVKEFKEEKIFCGDKLFKINS